MPILAAHHIGSTPYRQYTRDFAIITWHIILRHNYTITLKLPLMKMSEEGSLMLM